MGGAPAGYDAAAYGRDFKLFRSLMKTASPKTMILGPGTVGETAVAADLLAAPAAGLDALSYHYYGMVSQRCGGSGTPDAALSDAWLSGTDKALAFYRTLRDRLEPGKPIWLTETAEAACGGNPWAATFLDTFRYLDQLGRLAKAGVQVVMHNTLAASDYGLLDERTLRPRPNYWGALLWRRLMGATVLDAGLPVQAGLHVYAHCQRGAPGGVSLLVINTDRAASHALVLPMESVRYTLSAANPADADISLNGHALQLDAGNRTAAARRRARGRRHRDVRARHDYLPHRCYGRRTTLADNGTRLLSWQNPVTVPSSSARVSCSKPALGRDRLVPSCRISLLGRHRRTERDRDRACRGLRPMPGIEPPVRGQQTSDQRDRGLADAVFGGRRQLRSGL